MGFRFQKFPVYQELRLFVREIYRLSKTLPKIEQFELGAQLRRAAASILLNIAEGSAKKSDRELNRYILIAIGSLTEIVAILDICLDQKYINQAIHEKYTKKCEDFAKRLYGFSRKLTKKG